MSKLSLSQDSTRKSIMQESIGQGSAERRIVLLGRTGAGKSSTANTILREKLFETSCHANSVTSKCQAETKTVDGRNITVIDTPGFFDTNSTDENELKREIVKCITECSLGVHAFVIHLPVDRQTEQEKKVVAEILKMFGEEALKYTVVLFTHGDQLDDDVTIREFVDKNEHLKALVQKCGNRLHVVDNKYWNNPAVGDGYGDKRSNAVQIRALLNTIDQMVQQNGGSCYTNEILQMVEQSIQEEMAKGKNRDEAKQSVRKRLLILLTGVAVGSLCGALLGVSTCVVAVVASCSSLMKHAKPITATGADIVDPEKTAEGVVALPKKIQVTKVLVAATGAAALTGMMAGAAVGANAAKEAETVNEAAIRAAAAVIDRAASAARFIEEKIAENMKET